LRSSSVAAGLSPTLSSASGVSNATWWQAAQSALTRSPRPICRPWPPRQRC
jgi:hypothetical protein